MGFFAQSDFKIILLLFKASADAFYKLKCPSVCLFTFEVPFNGLFAEVGCQIFLEIQDPWGKVMERSGLAFEHFCLKVV